MSADERARLVSDLRIGFEGPRARARTTMHEGDVAFVALGWSEHRPPHSYEEAGEWMARTGRFWQEWPRCRDSMSDHALRAARLAP